MIIASITNEMYAKAYSIQRQAEICKACNVCGLVINAVLWFKSVSIRSDCQ